MPSSATQAATAFFQRTTSVHSGASSTGSFTPEPTFKLPQTPGSPMINRHGSQETLSMLSHSITATSINSTSTINTTFESNWMPNSFVVGRTKYKVTLKLKSREIDLLRKSWAIVTSTDTRASDNHKETLSSSPSSAMGHTFNTASFASFLFCIQFYNNLISMDPEIETLIPSIRHQASAFAGVISVALGTLEDLSKMKESLANLGRLHARILGIDSPYFKIMGEALIKTFQDWFGNSPESFPLELEESWIKLYCFLANSIIQGGVDPIIEYNIQPARNSQADFNSMMDEAPEIANEHLPTLDENNKYDASSSTNTSIIDDYSKRISISKSSSTISSASVSKYSSSSPSSQTQSQSYIPSASSSGGTSRISRLKKSRAAAKDGDCTIM